MPRKSVWNRANGVFPRLAPPAKPFFHAFSDGPSGNRRKISGRASDIPFAMFFDSGAWPPPPDGFDPPPPEPRLSASQERVLLRLIGMLLLAVFVGPLAGSSVIVAIVAIVRAIFAVV